MRKKRGEKEREGENKGDRAVVRRGRTKGEENNVGEMADVENGGAAWK